MRPLSWLPPLALLAVVACKSAVPTVPPTITAFTADPATVTPGQPSSTLSWSVTGATALAITPGVGDVTGTSAVAVVPTATTTYTLTATNAAGSDSESVTVTFDDAIVVEGRVIGLAGRPTAGATVEIAGRPPATTDADGRFTIGGVETPYDVAIAHPADPVGVLYLGLTLANPTLVQTGGGVIADHQATIGGALGAGAGFPQPPDHHAWVSFVSADTRLSVEADAASGAYLLDPVTWFGPTTTVGALHALQWRVGASGLPEAYTGHGYRPLTLHAGAAPYAAQDMSLLPVTASSLSGAVVVPAGLVLLGRTMGAVFGEGGAMPIVLESNPGPAFTYVTPVIDETTMTLAAIGAVSFAELSFAARAGFLPGATGVELVLPAIPQLGTPPAGATGVDHTTEFRWSVPAGGVTLVQFQPETAGAGPTLVAVTTGGSATIPYLADLGLALPPSAGYRWQAYHLPLFASVDAAVSDAAAFLGSWFATDPLAWYRDGAFASSAVRGFTTAP